MVYGVANKPKRVIHSSKAPKENHAPGAKKLPLQIFYEVVRELTSEATERRHLNGAFLISKPIFHSTGCDKHQYVLLR